MTKMLSRGGGKGLEFGRHGQSRGQARGPTRRPVRSAKRNERISAPEAERLGLYPDWSTWPLGANVLGSWEWLFAQVQAGSLPDLPCHWSEQIAEDRTAIYWLDPQARTRHFVVGYGRLILTSPAATIEAVQRLH